LFDRLGQMYLHRGLRRFARAHNMLTIKFFNKTMCYRHYNSNEDE
jgi:hypothetical protein